MTHHPSPEGSRHDVLLMEPDEAETSQTTPLTEGSFCHFCQKPVSDFLRRDFLGPDRGNSLATKLFRSKSLIQNE